MLQVAVDDAEVTKAVPRGPLRQVDIAMGPDIMSFGEFSISLFDLVDSLVMEAIILHLIPTPHPILRHILRNTAHHRICPPISERQRERVPIARARGPRAYANGDRPSHATRRIDPGRSGPRKNFFFECGVAQHGWGPLLAQMGENRFTRAEPVEK